MKDDSFAELFVRSLVEAGNFGRGYAMLERPEDIRRQAECATMLVAIAKVMLNAEAAEFAAWLRSVADDIEAQGRSAPDDAEQATEALRRSN